MEPDDLRVLTKWSVMYCDPPYAFFSSMGEGVTADSAENVYTAEFARRSDVRAAIARVHRKERQYWAAMAGDGASLGFCVW